jgi:putative endonuclease
MTAARQALGRETERLVAETLERRGMRIVARNARTASVRGELDLVALDGPQLVFVEVKARRAGSTAGPERPVMAVGRRKRLKLRSLALAWLRDHDDELPFHTSIRFDVVGVVLGAHDEVVDWEHIRAAF